MGGGGGVYGGGLRQAGVRGGGVCVQRHIFRQPEAVWKFLFPFPLPFLGRPHSLFEVGEKYCPGGGGLGGGGFEFSDPPKSHAPDAKKKLLQDAMATGQQLVRILGYTRHP